MNGVSEPRKRCTTMAEYVCSNCSHAFSVPDWLDTEIRCPKCRANVRGAGSPEPPKPPEAKSINGQLGNISAHLRQLTADLEVLYHAYKKSGLLEEKADSDTAKKLLGGGDDAYRFKRTFLLVDAIARNRLGRMVHDGGLRHIAVFGGNNVGKSTTVNILAGDSIAGASPKGGYTRHAHGFCVASPTREAIFGANPYVFSRFEMTALDSRIADQSEVDYYALAKLHRWALPSDVVLWDVPDCDSTESRQYLHSVVEAVTLADVLVYVTSGERYAVENVVEWVFLLSDAGIEIVECLNRTRRADHASVMKDQREKHFPHMAKQLGLKAPDLQIVGLLYLVDGEEQDLWGEAHPEAAVLRDETVKRLRAVDRRQAARAALAFVSDRMNSLVEPVCMEVLAKQQWTEAVQAAATDFLRTYEQKYLTSDKTIEPFSRLNLAILNLLDPDIPGLKETFKWLRLVTRWPVMVVLAIGGRLYELAQGYIRPESTGPENENLPPELQAYTDAHTYVLNRLGDLIQEACDTPRHHPFWNAIDDAWNDELPKLSKQLLQQVHAHIEKTEDSIQRAAKDILDQLAASPVLLNTLRTAKVAANIGGVLAGFAIPGKGGYLYDLLQEAFLGPILITSVEAATAASIERFVRLRKDELVKELKSDAKAIAADLYHKPLLAMADQAMNKTATLGVDAELPNRVLQTIKAITAALEEESVPS